MKYRYEGIKRGYLNLQKISKKLSDYVSLCRPFTIFGAFLAGFFLDVLFSRLSSNPLNLFHPILVGLTLALIQGGGQVCNQSISEEVMIDLINGKDYRPTVNGRISLKEAKIMSIILFSLGILLAFSLNVSYGMFSLLIAFFAVAYTVPPLRMKKRFLLNNLWQGVARGLLPAIYVASAYEGYGLLPVFFGVALALWVTGAQATKDFCDVRGDSAHGVKSFPVVLGEKGALNLMSFFMAVAFVCFNVFVMLGYFPLNFIVLNALILPSTFIVIGLKKNLKVKFSENNLSWVFFYGTLGLFYLIPAFLV